MPLNPNRTTLLLLLLLLLLSLVVLRFLMAFAGNKSVGFERHPGHSVVELRGQATVTSTNGPDAFGDRNICNV